MIKEFKADNLKVKIFETRLDMGVQAANEAIDCIKMLLSEKESINIVFAAAPSQNDFLASLSGHHEIDWRRVNAFHMDEYIGLSKDAPQGFGNFLKNAIFEHLPFRNVFYLKSDEFPVKENCERYEDLLKKYPIDIVFMGIGENGHIAFNDPHVASFTDTNSVKIVDLDIKCRQQQVNDGCFDSLDAVPTHAITLTIPALMSAKYLFCMVPTERKAMAIKATIEGAINEKCPASILRNHTFSTLYIDKPSASLLTI
ncbi:MAG: glucosamine-6-phosphate deaminase [Paludibacter sp.]